MLEGIKNWKRRREEEKKKARRTAVTEFAAASGLSYSDTDQNVEEKFRTVHVTFVFPDRSLASLPGPLGMKNMLSGRWQGLPVAEADFSIIASQASTVYVGALAPIPAGQAFSLKTHHVSAVIADLPAALPDLMIQRMMPWLSDEPGQGQAPQYPQVPRYHVESEFDRKWVVKTRDTAFAAKLIDASMITWLRSLSESGALVFKLSGRNLLLVWHYLLEAPDLGAIFDTAKSFTDHIPRQIWAEYGTR